MSALAALAEAFEKAGLIKPGKPSLLKRVGFLLSTGSNERNYKVGRYLEGRKAGKGFGPKGKRRARTGTYTGVYATGVNKSEHVMDAIELLDEAIEKAGLLPKGVLRGGGARRVKAALIRRNVGAFDRRTSGVHERTKDADRRELKRTRQAIDYLGRRVRKSADEPTALDQLDEAFEKAASKGMLSRTGPRLRSVKRLLSGEAKSRSAAAKDYKEYRGFREPRLKNKVWGYPAYMKNQPKGATRYQRKRAERKYGVGSRILD